MTLRRKEILALPDISPQQTPIWDLAYDLWWTWSVEAQEFFSLFCKQASLSRLSPIEALCTLPLAQIEELRDMRETAELHKRVLEQRARYQALPSTWSRSAEDIIAYFSAEFGVHESLPLYAGGLGVLAGDFLKGASDLGIPVVGVGLFYSEGYFAQRLSLDGWQEEFYPPLDSAALALRPVKTSEGKRLLFPLELNGEQVYVSAWEALLGRVRLYLLDTNVEQNKPEFRSITARLYGGDVHNRMRQEIVLGVGGMRLLAALGLRPAVYHMNEGHSAFLILEQIRSLMTHAGLDFESALLAARSRNLFTTHTPVPAGNDVFPRDIVEHYFASLLKSLHLDAEKLLALGRIHPHDHGEGFAMTVLAIRGSSFTNGVSKLHGTISRRLWQNIFPELQTAEIPIASVTNGVHTASWTAPEFSKLYERYLGSSWREASGEESSWRAVSGIPDHELWSARQTCRKHLIDFCRKQLSAQRLSMHIASTQEVLDPSLLTIGFARRFATYKRATLLLSDPDRLQALLTHPQRPMQFIFAGKAHPADHAGKEFIAKLIAFARERKLSSRFLFLENYDMQLARMMVQGVDLWFNTPRRPLEASGTSGMKVALSGGLNASILDGWWCEGFTGDNGWAIGHGEEFVDNHYQDTVDSRILYDLLEHEIAPLFYQRDGRGIPAAWLARVKKSIASLAWKFSASRMVAEYRDAFYAPLSQHADSVSENSWAGIKQEAEVISQLRAHWNEIHIRSVDVTPDAPLEAGTQRTVRAVVETGTIDPSQLTVQVCLDRQPATSDPVVCAMSPREPGCFQGDIRIPTPGAWNLAVRVVPCIQGSARIDIPQLITWWK